MESNENKRLIERYENVIMAISSEIANLSLLIYKKEKEIKMYRKMIKNNEEILANRGDKDELVN